MNILIYGAGVLGSLYAARLQDAGHSVTILARGQRLADIRERGLVLENAATGERTTTRVNVVEYLIPDDEYYWLIVIVRKNQLASILPDLAAHQQTPNVLFMLNNAAGPTEMIAALGRARVVLGFPGTGGTREGYVVRYVAGSGAIKGRTTLGELDGRVTPRLQQIAEAFRAAGFPVAFSHNMDAWLKTHVALVSPIANALYLAGGDIHRLAQMEEGVTLLVRAIHEGLQVLRANGIPITPSYLRVLEWLSKPILVAVMRRALNTPSAEWAIARHANAARDEMRQLACEFEHLVHGVEFETPALDYLRAFTDPAVEPVVERIVHGPTDWRRVLLGVGALTGLFIIAGRLSNRRPQQRGG